MFMFTKFGIGQFEKSEFG